MLQTLLEIFCICLISGMMVIIYRFGYEKGKADAEYSYYNTRDNKGERR